MLSLPVGNHSRLISTASTGVRFLVVRNDARIGGLREAMKLSGSHAIREFFAQRFFLEGLVDSRSDWRKITVIYFNSPIYDGYSNDAGSSERDFESRHTVTFVSRNISLSDSLGSKKTQQRRQLVPE